MTSPESSSPEPQEPHASPVPEDLETRILPETPDADHPRRRRLSGFIGNLGARYVAGDFMKGFQSHSAGLVGDIKGNENEEKGRLDKDGNPRMKTVQDPLTGEDTKVPDYKMPVVPIRKSQHTSLYGRGHGKHKTRHPEAQRNHPLFADISKGILAERGNPNDFRLAVRSVYQIGATAERAAQGQPGLARRGVNHLMSEGMRREDQMRNGYANLMEASYDAVMDVEDTFNPRERERNEGWNEDIRPNDETWNPVLRLKNIQALRARLYNDFMESRSGWATDAQNQIAANHLFEIGALNSMNHTILAAYLGVDSDALKEQFCGGDSQVVPQTVLNKLFFFIQFAGNSDPAEGQLSSAFVHFNPTEINDDMPIRRVDEVVRLQRDPQQRLRHGSDLTTANYPVSALPVDMSPVPMPADTNAGTPDQEVASSTEDLEDDQDLWVRTLGYVAGEHRKGKYKNVSFPTISVESIQNFIIDSDDLVKEAELEEGIDSDHIESLPDKEKEQVKARLQEIRRDVFARVRPAAEELHQRLIQERIIGVKTVRRDDQDIARYEVRKDSKEIRSIKQKYLDEKNT